ncbi:hypothetical protein BOTCAL_0106g00240 [Botryotinia calthae]|uniref:Uncharacterized protein n=1 Tax=Botryotinia calthae TaxID=38488 RepID=A0A4Y8D7W8_9HELO|nr:hypothetical protein BOTCAL_0106g00240 [Botryotinia calthae]
MCRPYSFTRTSSSHARYNPIYEETEVKKAEASGNSRWSFPFFTSNQPTGYETVKPQPRQSSSPPPRTSGTFFATNYNTYTPTSSTDNIYDAAEKSTKPASDRRKRFSFPSFPFFGTNNSGDGTEVDDDYGYRSNSFNDGENRTDPFLDPVDNLKKENKKEKQKEKQKQKQKQKTSTSTKDSDNKKPSKSWQERGSAKRAEAKEEKEKAKEQERARKRNSGLGWAKSWSFGGERFGGTILADGSGVRMPIFRCKGPCGLSCGF